MKKRFMKHVQLPSGEVLFTPHLLQLRLSHRCNIKCSHCYNDSGPNKKYALDIEAIIPLLEQARALGLTRTVLTGGEIFMHPELVVDIIKHAKANRLNVSIVTNGFWGKTDVLAQRMLTMIKDAGFTPPNDICFISGGEFHQEWIPSSTIKNAVAQYFAIFKHPVTIDFEFRKHKRAVLKQFEKIMAELPAEAFEIKKRTSFYRDGRDVRLDIPEEHLSHWSAFGVCDQLFRIAVQPNGDMLPCCGFNENIPELVVGNIHQVETEHIVKLAQKNDFVRILKNTSLSDLYHEVRETNPELPEYFSHICEVCELVAKHHGQQT